MKDYNLPPATEKSPDLAYCRSCGKSYGADFECRYCTGSQPGDGPIGAHKLMTEEEQLEAFIGRQRRAMAKELKDLQDGKRWREAVTKSVLASPYHPNNRRHSNEQVRKN